MFSKILYRQLMNCITCGGWIPALSTCRVTVKASVNFACTVDT